MNNKKDSLLILADLIIVITILTTLIVGISVVSIAMYLLLIQSWWYALVFAFFGVFAWALHYSTNNRPDNY